MEESHIIKGWDLGKTEMDGIHSKDMVCSASSLKFWSPPPLQVFKLNFDGASRGNLGPVGYGGVCLDSIGKIWYNYYGIIGIYTNKSVELEGLIRGFKCLIREG